jgi:L-fuconolactonase
MRVDAHQCFLDHARFEYACLPPAPSPLDKDYLPEHVAGILRRNRFDGLVAVAITGSLEETRWLLSLARDQDIIMGVVGPAGIDGPDFPAMLDELQQDAKLKGIRHHLPGSRSSLREIATRGLALDVRVGSSELQSIPPLVESFPELRLVIEHMGMPQIREAPFDRWAQQVELLAKAPRVYVKLSGLLTLATPAATVDELRPYVQHLLRTFGPARLMFGSDFPFCLVAAGLWKTALAIFTQALGAQSMETRSKILGETAQECYRLL